MNTLEEAHAEIARLQHLLDAVQWWEGVYNDQPLTREEIINELHDYRMVMTEVRQVYDHITEGRITKINTHAFEVIAVAESVIAEIVEDIIAEYKEGYDNN